MLPSQVRRTILDDHRWLRALLADTDEIARRVLEGDHALAGRLRERAVAMSARFLGHLRLEETDLVPALRDADERIRDVLLCAYRGLHRSARDRRFKLIEYVVEGQRTTQLFDLQEDPWELHNLAGQPAHAPKLAELRQELGRWRAELGDTQPGLGQDFWEGYDR
jgi:hypothetical protein